MSELSVHDRLDDERSAAVRALVAAAAATDGTAPLSEQFRLSLHHPRAAVAHLLAVDSAGTLTGYAQLDRSDTEAGPVGELVVAPEHRRHGIGSTLVEAVVERAAGSSLRLWSHGEHPGAARLAERFDFARDRVLWRMRRDLADPLPDLELGAGTALRSFRVGRDETEFLRVNNAAFARHPEQGGWDLARLAEREAESWFDPDGFLLAVDRAGLLLGFHWTKVHPATAGAEAIGEVYVLGVDPAAQGRRLGRALTLAGLHHLRGRGLSRVMLYVEADNTAAVRVYEKLNFTLWHTDVMYRL